jgi:hypothetical protein
MLAALPAALFLSASANANTVDLLDPLHIECLGCIDNGTNTPLPGPTSTFGFSSSPKGATGVMWLNILVPNTINLGTFVAPTVTGFGSGTTSLFSTTSWTGGLLNAYLGGLFNNNPSPDNNITAYLPSTQALDPGATGFFDFQLDVGTVGTPGLPGPGVVGDTFRLGGKLPLGSYVTAMMLSVDKHGNPDVINTANSGAGFINTQTSPVPLPAAFPFLATGLGGLWFVTRRRKEQQLPA